MPETPSTDWSKKEKPLPKLTESWRIVGDKVAELVHRVAESLCPPGTKDVPDDKLKTLSEAEKDNVYALRNIEATFGQLANNISFYTALKLMNADFGGRIFQEASAEPVTNSFWETRVKKSFLGAAAVGVPQITAAVVDDLKTKIDTLISDELAPYVAQKSPMERK